MSHMTLHQFAFFFYSHQKKVIVNKVISVLKKHLQLASIHGIFSFIQHLYIQRKTTKKFNFELLCLFYVPYNIQLLMCFKESRRLFFFFMTVMFQVTIEGPNITIKKFSSKFNTYFNRKFTSDCPIQHLWNCPAANDTSPSFINKRQLLHLLVCISTNCPSSSRKLI